MLIGYVKHYLNREGREYCQHVWVPYVREKAAAVVDDGFISIECKPGADVDEILITIKFKNDKAGQDWNDHPDHQKVINDLEPYRSRNYFEFCKTEDETSTAESVEYTRVEIKR